MSRKQIETAIEAVKRRIREHNDISGPGELVLDSTFDYYERWERAKKRLAVEGLTTEGRNGTVAHPLVAIADASYRNFLAGLRYLNLSVEDVIPDAEA